MLDVDAVVLVVGGTEVLVDGEDAAGRGGRARIAGRRRKYCDVLLDDALCASNWSHGVYGAGAARISFNTIRRCVAGTVVEERVQVGSIEVKAEARADNCVLLELDSWPRGVG